MPSIVTFVDTVQMCLYWLLLRHVASMHVGMIAEFLIILSVTKKHKNETQIDIRDAFHHLAQVDSVSLEGEVPSETLKVPKH